jgi:hypothetical protein
MSDLQNDPDRAGGLVSDAVGEFVAEQPGGAFDPRTFRTDHPDPDPDPDARGVPLERSTGTPRASDGSDNARGVPVEHHDGPPMDDERMSGPGEEIEKAG